MENRYNLIDEQWIPVVDVGKVGLRQIFSDCSLTALGGNPIEKIAVFKLLLAIAQSACTPKDEEEWKSLGKSGMQKKVLEYLDTHRDCFWLYGEKPFLQMPAIKKAKTQSYGALKMEVAVGNTTVVTQIQKETPLDDSEKALLLIVQMNFAFGGKKVDNSVSLSSEYEKSKTGKFGSSLGFMGVLHSFPLLQCLIESVYLNLFSMEILNGMGSMFTNGLGNAPWECMPSGEDDSIVREYKKTYMSRLVSLNRFILLEDNDCHYSEGIQLPDYSDFMVDPSVTVDFSAKPKPKIVWSNPERRPWRQLTSLLAFLDGTKSSAFVCYQLRSIFFTGRIAKAPVFSIWSGGVRVSSNAGEQYLTGTDDFIESEIQFSSDFFNDTQGFYSSLLNVMEKLESFSKLLYSSTVAYYKGLKTDGNGIASKAANVFWQLCESEFQSVIDICSGENIQDNLKPMYKKFKSFVSQIYDEYCPKDTARQMEAWAKNKPYMRKSEGEED